MDSDLLAVLGTERTADRMAPWGDPFDSHCPSRKILDHVTSKWGVLVVVALAARPHRFGELHRTIDGVSEKMLTQTLRALEGDGFVHRNSHGTVPPRVDYSLTPSGEGLAAVLIPLVRWVADHAGAAAETV